MFVTPFFAGAHDVPVATVALAWLAAQTSTVQLMTGIIPLYSRSPALIAQTAATLAAQSASSQRPNILLILAEDIGPA